MRELSYLVLVVALLMGVVWAGVREGKVLEWKDMEIWLKTDVLPMISKHSLRNYTLETTKEGRYVQGRAKNEETFTITVEPDPGVKHAIPVLIDWDSGCTDQAPVGLKWAEWSIPVLIDWDRDAQTPLKPRSDRGERGKP